MGPINQIHQLFRKAFHLGDMEQLLFDSVDFSPNDLNDYDKLLLLLNGSSNHHQLNYFIKEVTLEELNTLQSKSDFPFLSICSNGKDIFPCFFEIGKGIERAKTLTSISQQAEFENQALNLTPVKSQESDKYIIITGYPLQNIASNPDSRYKVLSRFLKLLKHEKREIGYVYLYASIAGLISLSLPLGIQSIIGFVSSGQVTTSLVVLIIFIILGILITGFLQIAQISIVEHIQQRLFARTAFDFAYRIPKLNIELQRGKDAPELINRFFDVVTLQKGFAKILLDFSAATLQIVLGLVLLSFYHPYFIFFGVLLIVVLLTTLLVTGPLGLSSSLKESKYKYNLAHWFEEIARSLGTFKLASYSNIPQEKTDYYTGNYLFARSKHFKILVTQYISFVIFKTLITAVLLIIGCYLVVNKEINIGQLVASEIVIILIMNAVEKVVINLDSVYDVLTSLEKLGQINDLPIQTISKGLTPDQPENKGLNLKVANLSYSFNDEKKPILNDINFSIESGELFCICGKNGSGKTTLINIINGLFINYQGTISIGNFSLKDIDKNYLHKIIGENTQHEEIFDGTLFENITLGASDISTSHIIKCIDIVGLQDFSQKLEHGLKTQITSNSNKINKSVAQRIIMARAIAKSPQLLILDDMGISIDKFEKKSIYEKIKSEFKNSTIIFISNDIETIKLCSYVGYIHNKSMSVYKTDQFLSLSNTL
jgi:ABC-type bacteriocin/lantibiotic exporter with double-glycine peptidase domain